MEDHRYYGRNLLTSGQVLGSQVTMYMQQAAYNYALDQLANMYRTQDITDGVQQPIYSGHMQQAAYNYSLGQRAHMYGTQEVTNGVQRAVNSSQTPQVDNSNQCRQTWPMYRYRAQYAGKRYPISTLFTGGMQHAIRGQTDSQPFIVDYIYALGYKLFNTHVQDVMQGEESSAFCLITFIERQNTRVLAVQREHVPPSENPEPGLAHFTFKLYGSSAHAPAVKDVITTKPLFIQRGYFPESYIKQLTDDLRKKVQDTKPVTAEEDESCAICLCDMEESENLRRLPCDHSFHAACINQWLTQERRNTCPYCRASVY